MIAGRPVGAVAYTKKELETFEDARLAIYASRAAAAARRRRIDPEADGTDYRTEFQRDRDRTGTGSSTPRPSAGSSTRPRSSSRSRGTTTGRA